MDEYTIPASYVRPGEHTYDDREVLCVEPDDEAQTALTLVDCSLGLVPNEASRRNWSRPRGPSAQEVTFGYYEDIRVGVFRG